MKFNKLGFECLALPMLLRTYNAYMTLKLFFIRVKKNEVICSYMHIYKLVNGIVIKIAYREISVFWPYKINPYFIEDILQLNFYKIIDFNNANIRL